MRGLEELPYAARLLTRVPGYLRRPLTVSEARATVEYRLLRREPAFLELVRETVFGYAGSPYRRLCERAGCEYGDVERLVRDAGVEGALHALAREGIYVTVDELKGRRPIVRGQETVGTGGAAFRNPLAQRHVSARSSGSGGRPTHVHVGLSFVRDCAANTLVHLDARGGADWEKADWETPGAGAMFRLLKYGSFGRPVARWFTPVDPSSSVLHPRYAWGEQAVRLASKLSGRPLPPPAVATATDPLPVARWMASVLAAGRVPHVVGFASAGVRLARAALDAGIDVAGGQFVMAGEPVTDARVAAVRRAGLVAVPRYGSIETGPIGYACLEPRVSDDVHVLSDLVCVVQAGGAVTGLPDDALLVSGLRPTAPFVLLNLSMGDSASLEERVCGCPVAGLGWGMHLSSVRSFEKLTAGGATFLGTDIIRVLEEALPVRFGGQPTDYQLVEGESEDGLPVVALRIDPRLGPLSERDVVDAFFGAVAQGDGGERLMTMLWTQQRMLRVERERPLSTGSGKFQHFVPIR